jgi:hypothetical protein
MSEAAVNVDGFQEGNAAADDLDDSADELLAPVEFVACCRYFYCFHRHGDDSTML